ncbi:abortive infection protein [Halorubrum aidingense JCM 13560]|uniref:Abortive infection protein n=1 Tax=Halorubrum aidingense JCM 13560 TaxID=1230454 RepID=M0PCQ9_9EURY|nr:hypothetical protein [Halorubrum aidingense]EMA67648.1 abortive infection protein [Halorubrum aidingense JCM 13560]
MTEHPPPSTQANVPFWTVVALTALYLPVSLVASSLIDSGERGYPAALDAVAGPVAETGGVLAAAVGGAAWLLVGGALLVAFRAELGSMRRRTAWRPPEKGYLILAAGALLAHPLTGLPFIFLIVAGYTLHRGLRVR